MARQGKRGMAAQDFQAFAELRIDEMPEVPGSAAMDPRYWVEVAEVMVDILLAAIPPEMAGTVREKVMSDASAVDPAAMSGLLLLNNWTLSKMNGGSTDLARDLSDDEVTEVAQAVRPLVVVLVGATDTERVATLDALLTVKSRHGHTSAILLKVMLDTAVEDLGWLEDRTVDGATADTGRATVEDDDHDDDQDDQAGPSAEAGRPGWRFWRQGRSTAR
jgi:hypothetical protein